MFDEMTKRLDAMPGDKSVWFKNCQTGETYAYHADIPLIAASVIKIPIMIEAYRAQQAGELSLEEEISFDEKAMFPSCGVLTYIQPFGIQRMSMAALIELMIIVSDNSATNLLINRLGIEAVNKTLRALGLQKTTLRRRLFDAQAAAQGLENTITAREMGQLLERIAALPSTQPVVSAQADQKMLATLLHQRLNGKIPFYLHDYAVAHKTGEDSGISHDVGVVYDKKTNKPLCVLCFCAEHVCAPDFERLIQDFSREMVQSVQTK